jgi:dienelactone hydrolase
VIARLLAAALMLAPFAARGEVVSIRAEDGAALRAIVVEPAAGVARRPAVVALHGCTGLAAPDRPLRLPAREADWAARLSALGHRVVLPDSFGSRGLGPACGRAEHPVRPGGLRAGDARAALAWAAVQADEPPGGGILMGWSHGGSTVLATLGAPLPPGLLRAAIAFYPGCGALLAAAPGWAAPVPLLMLLGGADDWTPAHRCEALAARAPERIELRLFPGAHHNFDHPGIPIRSRLLPNGQTVTTGTDPAAREGAIAAVLGFLARQ